MFEYLLLGCGIFGLYYFFMLPKIKKEREKEQKLLSEQILRLFVQGEKLRHLQLHKLLSERTGGKKRISVQSMERSLGLLVKEGKLISELCEPIVHGEKLSYREYHLPK
jgi:hypothetical protein